MPDEYRQIILVPVADGRGNRAPPRRDPLPTEQILPGAKLRVVCVPTHLEEPSPQHQVPFPWQRPHHPKTGLNKPNVAKCNWLARVDQGDVIKVLGFAPPAHLARIEQELRTLSAGR
jgi:hypothetical protein